MNINDYMKSFGDFNAFKIDPSKGIEASKKIGENNLNTARSVAQVTYDAFASISKIAQDNINASLKLAKGAKWDDISSIDASGVIQSALDNNNKILNEVQKAQGKIQDIVEDCATKNFDELSGVSPKKKAAA